jgi:hypothetical protein
LKVPALELHRGYRKLLKENEVGQFDDECGAQNRN